MSEADPPSSPFTLEHVSPTTSGPANRSQLMDEPGDSIFSAEKRDNKVKAIIAGVAAILLLALTLIWRWTFTHGTLTKHMMSFSVQISWAFALSVAAFVTAAIAAVFSATFFRKAVSERRTPGKNLPIQASASQLIKKLEPDAHSTELKPGTYANNVFTVEGVSEILQHEQKVNFDRERKRKSQFSKTFGKDEVKEGLSDLQIKLFIGCLKSINNLTISEFKTMYSKTQWIHLNDGDVLYKSGQSCESGFYFVVEGKLKGYLEIDGSRTIQVAEFTIGESIGEWELLEKGTKRKLTVIASGTCELIQISSETFASILEDLPRVALSFTRTTISRQWRVAHFVLRDFLDMIHGISAEDDGRLRSHSSFDILGSFISEDEMGQLASLVEPSQKFQLEAGDLLYEEGAFSNARLFILVSGKLAVYRSSRASSSLLSRDPDIDEKSAQRISMNEIDSPEELGPGTVFGAASCFGGSVRLESVRVLSESTFVWVNARQLETHSKLLGKRLSQETGRLFYPVISKFYEMGFERDWVQAGHILFTENSPVRYLYIIVSGRVRLVSRRPDGSDEIVNECGRGECVGEMAILAGNSHHSLTVFALRDTELVRVSVEMLKTIFQKHPRMLEKLSSVMAVRLRQITSGKSGSAQLQNSKVSTVAVVPINASVDVDLFCSNLKTALSDFGKTMWISGNDKTSLLEENGITEKADDTVYRHRVTSILTDLEERHEFLVFSTDPELSPWSQCCVRQADVVFILSNAKSTHLVSGLERDLIWESQKKTFSRKELVLVHSDDTIIPSGTKKWFKERRLHSFHHVKVTQKSGYFRLARHLAGRTIGVVLGGGGARGLAHFGAMKALEEQGVDLDFIGGTSQGAFMAALHAYYVDIPVIEERCRYFASRMGNVWELLSDATFPIMSYFSGKKLNESIIEFFGDTRIEDLWIKYFCITTNMSDADICVHRTGSLWMAVRASMSIIDYLPPMLVNSQMLIDGGYINNLPVDVMRDIYSPHFIVAVDVENKSSAMSLTNVTNYGLYLSGWWLLWRKTLQFIPFLKGSNVPRYSDIIYSLIYMNHSRNVRRFINERYMDLYVQPELGNTMLLDYHKFQEIQEIGYRFTKLAVTEFMNKHKRFWKKQNIPYNLSAENLNLFVMNQSVSPILQSRVE